MNREDEDSLDREEGMANTPEIGDSIPSVKRGLTRSAQIGQATLSVTPVGELIEIRIDLGAYTASAELDLIELRGVIDLFRMAGAVVTKRQEDREGTGKKEGSREDNSVLDLLKRLRD